MASARQSSKPRKGSKKAPAKVVPVPQGKLRRWVFQPAPLAVVAGIVSILVLSPYLPLIVPDLSDQPEYQFSMSDLRVSPPPEWVPSGLHEKILSESDLGETVSLLDSGLCQKITETWRMNPWVRKVDSVRIDENGIVQMELEYRAPVAFIEVDQGLYPIDVEGVLLPPDDFTEHDLERLPVVRNIASFPRSAAGQAWGDPVVHTAARLAASLLPDQDAARHWKKYQLKSIIAPDHQGGFVSPEEMVFELETQSGSRIVWGKIPGADPLEQPVEQKLARLDWLSKKGTLAAGQGPYRIDIRRFDDISLEPLNVPVYR